MIEIDNVITEKDFLRFYMFKTLDNKMIKSVDRFFKIFAPILMILMGLGFLYTSNDYRLTITLFSFAVITPFLFPILMRRNIRNSFIKNIKRNHKDDIGEKQLIKLLETKLVIESNTQHSEIDFNEIIEVVEVRESYIVNTENEVIIIIQKASINDTNKLEEYFSSHGIQLRRKSAWDI